MVRYSKKKARRFKKSRRQKRVYRLRGGQTDKKIFNFYNNFHHGDNILNLKFFYDISKNLIENNIQINYYYNNFYITQAGELERYVDSNTLKLFSMGDKPPDAVEITMGNDISGVSFRDFEKYYSLFYAKILNILNLQNLSIDTSVYQKEDYLLDIYNKLDPKFKDVDVLFINSKPNSSQFDFNKEKMDALAVHLAEKYKLVTTTPVNDLIPCTMTAGLKIQDIGAVSTHAKYIIAVFSGPISPCFNLYTKNNVKKWYILYNVKNPFTEINAEIIEKSDGLSVIEHELLSTAS